MPPTRTGATRRRTSTARATTTRRRNLSAAKNVNLNGFGFYAGLYGPIVKGMIEGLTWLGQCFEATDHLIAHANAQQTPMAVPTGITPDALPGLGLIGKTVGRSRKATTKALVGV